MDKNKKRSSVHDGNGVGKTKSSSDVAKPKKIKILEKSSSTTPSSSSSRITPAATTEYAMDFENTLPSMEYSLGDEDLMAYSRNDGGSVPSTAPSSTPMRIDDGGSAFVSSPSTRATTDPINSNSPPKIIFVEGPVLNQVIGSCNGGAAVQHNVDVLSEYLKRINFAGSIRTAFVINTVHSDARIEYFDSMDMALRFPVNAKDFFKYSNMVFNCYTKLIDNLHSLATVAINVNYTVDKSPISNLLTFFINACVGQFTQPITAALERQTIVRNAIDEKLNGKLREYAVNRQDKLLNYYNRALAGIQAYEYFKFTPNNDANVEYNKTTDNILQVYLNIHKIAFQLNF
ncbi:hypothetical protein [Orgyia pseudotsugata single capsid nuclopolyhedrovirus]|nr:hypothetical protein [Orgyia pseudotsugata single capsid nuclopolyhedrovirus]